jgi:hypothetical protein|nr:hypothetical protein [Ruminococcus bromii]
MFRARKTAYLRHYLTCLQLAKAKLNTSNQHFEKSECFFIVFKPVEIDQFKILMGLPSATLAWYKQPPAMRVCIKSYTKKSPIVLQ